MVTITDLNPIALRKAKIVYNFGLTGCNRVKFEKDHETGLKCVHVVLDPFFHYTGWTFRGMIQVTEDIIRILFHRVSCPWQSYLPQFRKRLTNNLAICKPPDKDGLIANQLAFPSDFVGIIITASQKSNAGPSWSSCLHNVCLLMDILPSKETEQHLF